MRNKTVLGPALHDTDLTVWGEVWASVGLTNPTGGSNVQPELRTTKPAHSSCPVCSAKEGNLMHRAYGQHWDCDQSVPRPFPCCS